MQMHQHINRSMIVMIVLILLSSTTLGEGIVFAEELKVDVAPQAKSAILLDMDTGTALYEKNSTQRLAPASITKIMTMLLVMEAIHSEKLKWDDLVVTSERAASMGGSQIFLEVGEEMSVDDLMKGVAIASGNDATVALAEHISGTEEAFVHRMNERAKELGMQDTNFVNTNGLPADNHYTSAKDIALMSRELMKHEEITRFTSIYEDYLRQDSDNPFWLVNTNRLVKFYEGMDGLKTGYTQEAKYCLAATAQRGDMRVIAVVMGTPKPKVRNAHITAMMNYAFSQYDTHPIYKAGEVLGTVKIDKGSKTMADLIAPYQISVLTKKGESVDQYQPSLQTPDHIMAPVQMGDVLGKVDIQREGQTEVEVELVATEDIPRATLWQLLKRTTLSLFGVSY